MRISISLIIFLINIFSILASDEDLFVDLGHFGRIRGRYGETIKGRQVVEFLSIPYAIPPVGELRFMPSVRLDRITTDGEIFNATVFGPKCTQPGLSSEGTSEDCLAISVYTPQIKKSENQELLPVLVWVHGGSFIGGTGNDFNGNRLLDKNIILVSVNYRNSIPGYFSLGIEEAPGNAAIHDVLCVLSWVQDYIEFFGGNKNRVNLSGQSAGAAVVTHVMLSPLAKGLVHGVIAQSGSAIEEWASVRDSSINGGFRMAQFCGCTLFNNSTDLPAIAQCMKKIPHELMNLNAIRFIVTEVLQGRIPFDHINPWVEMPPNPQAVIPDDPVNILERGKQNRINFMAGANRHDGSGIMLLLSIASLVPNGLINEEFLKWEIIPFLMKFLNVENKHGFYQMIENEFLIKSKLSGNLTAMAPELIDISSAFFFKSGVFRFAQMHSRIVKNTYLYSFDYNWRAYSTETEDENQNQKIANQYGLLNNIMEILKTEKNYLNEEKISFKQMPGEFPEGVGHNAELEYLFHWRQLSPQDQIISDQIVTYWANFCTFGNPNGNETSGGEYPEWPKFSEKNPQLIVIDKSTRIEENYPKLWPGVSYELFPSDELDDASSTLTSDFTITSTTEAFENCPKEVDNKENLFKAIFIAFLCLFIVTLLGSLYYIRKIKRNNV